MLTDFAPKRLHRCGITQATRNRPADSAVKLPDGLFSTLFLDALIARLVAAKKAAQETPS